MSKFYTELRELIRQKLCEIRAAAEKELVIIRFLGFKYYVDYSEIFSEVELGDRNENGSAKRTVQNNSS